VATPENALVKKGAPDAAETLKVELVAEVSPWPKR